MGKPLEQVTPALCQYHSIWGQIPNGTPTGMVGAFPTPGEGSQHCPEAPTAGPSGVVSVVSESRGWTGAQQ